MMKSVFLLFVVPVLITACARQKQPFTLLDKSETGIDFENTLTYSEDINAYLFKSFYNGAGVGLADFNNDGNLDIIFCGNQVPNKLYLGNGKFGFSDVTRAAGLEREGCWSTGVSIVDINEDGWEDIYVCKSGPLNTPYRRNELFINNGPDATGQISFREAAAAHGLDDTGFSVHAVFLDYDRDGDLDMYLSNNSQHPSDLVIDAGYETREKRNGGTKLYKNTGERFTDVAKEAGIYNSAIGFGLGVGVGDVNRDGWPDIYIANDFFEKDYLYINQQDGTFKESINSLTNEISLGSMGVDIADINHDGMPDVFVTEMLPLDKRRLQTKVLFDNWDQYSLRYNNGYHRQFPRNTFQINRGTNPVDSQIHFSEVARYSGVAATDWSWGVQMFDFDNDGQKEIFITNGIGKDLLDRDFLAYYDNPGRLQTIFKATGKVMTELFDNMPSQPISNYLFRLDSNMVFKNIAEYAGVGQPAFSSGSAYGDIDNDGDLDLVVNNVNSPPFVYRNEQEKKQNNYISLQLQKRTGITAIGSQVSVWAGGKLFFEELYPMRGAMSVSDDRLLIGLGQAAGIDSLQIRWPNGQVDVRRHLPVNQQLALLQPQVGNSTDLPASGKSTIFSRASGMVADLDFIHKESNFVDFDRDQLLFQMTSNEGPAIAIGDINGDKKDDFFIGGAKGQVSKMYQQGINGFSSTNETLLQNCSQMETQSALFFDADNDGDQDLLVGSGSCEFLPGAAGLKNKLFINDGSGKFKNVSMNLPQPGSLSTSIVIAADFDSDGDQDLFLGGRSIPGVYGVPASSFVFENDGHGKFQDVTQKKASILRNLGMITGGSAADVDGDGDADLVLAGEWMPITLLVNDRGQFRIDDQDSLRASNGFWNTLKAADLDGDGDEDFIVGNLGLNSFFRPDPKHPVQMYVNDFDKNGSIEHLVTTYWNDTSYPAVMKDELVKQLPAIQKRFLTFSDYQGKQVEEIISAEQLQQSIKQKTFVTATSILWNDKGKLSMQALPYLAQLSPVYAICPIDLNGDGRLDIVLAGNQFNAKPQTGIYAADYGTVMLNQGGRSFRAVEHKDSGLFIEGQVRDFAVLRYRDGEFLIVAKNNDRLEVFKRNIQK